MLLAFVSLLVYQLLYFLFLSSSFTDQILIFPLIDVHPNSVCEKLGPKYASSSADELNERRDFYEDLLR